MVFANFKMNTTPSFLVMEKIVRLSQKTRLLLILVTFYDMHEDMSRLFNPSHHTEIGVLPTTIDLYEDKIELIERQLLIYKAIFSCLFSL